MGNIFLFCKKRRGWGWRWEKGERPSLVHDETGFFPFISPQESNARKKDACQSLGARKIGHSVSQAGEAEQEMSRRMSKGG